MGYFEEQTGRSFKRVRLLTLDIYFVTANLESCLGSVQTVNASLFIAISGQAPIIRKYSFHNFLKKKTAKSKS